MKKLSLALLTVALLGGVGAASARNYYNNDYYDNGRSCRRCDRCYRRCDRCRRCDRGRRCNNNCCRTNRCCCPFGGEYVG